MPSQQTSLSLGFRRYPTKYSNGRGFGRGRAPLQDIITQNRTSVLLSLDGFGSAARHSSCMQFSVPSRIECRQVTPCRASPASETKAGTSLPGPMKKLFHPLSHPPEPSFHPFHTAQDRRAFPIMRLEGHRRPAKVRRCAEKPYPRRALWKNRSLVAASWRAAPPYRA